MINNVVYRLRRELNQIQEFCAENGMKEYKLVEIQYKGNDRELVYVICPKNDPEAEIAIVSWLTVAEGKVIPMESKRNLAKIKSFPKRMSV